MFRDYVRIARPGHWVKNVFVLPGVLLAFFFQGTPVTRSVFIHIALGLIGVCLVASSNYVLNEILDAAGDAHHPDKKNRPVSSGRIRRSAAYAEWLLLAIAGLAVSAAVNRPLFLSCLALWGMALCYNVPPLRCKDRPYLDVLSESVNNPIRLAIGWYSVGAVKMPTVSVLLAYWMFGAFLMAVKRFAEKRYIRDRVRAEAYRKSFRFYTETRLLVSILFYVAMFGMFSGVFIARYRLELVLAAPLIGVAVGKYFRLGFDPHSPAMKPETLWRYPSLLIPVGLAFLACSFLLFYDWEGFRLFFAPAFSPDAIP